MYIYMEGQITNSVIFVLYLFQGVLIFFRNENTGCNTYFVYLWERIFFSTRQVLYLEFLTLLKCRRQILEFGVQNFS
jgi:hypothetical protein